MSTIETGRVRRGSVRDQRARAEGTLLHTNAFSRGPNAGRAQRGYARPIHRQGAVSDRLAHGSGGARMVIVNRAIHTGDIFGIPSKTIVSLANLMSVLQVVSGGGSDGKPRRARRWR